MSEPFTARDALGWGVLLLGMGAVALVGRWLFGRWDKISTERAVKRTEDQWAKRETADKEFFASARRLPAKVVFAFQIGQYNLQPLMSFHLRIEAPEGAYEVDVEHAVGPQYAHLYGDGCKLHVYVDPKDREHVKFHDWETAEDASTKS